MCIGINVDNLTLNILSQSNQINDLDNCAQILHISCL